jgi:radical SAM superfamily enzyme YgiQ (UPF0313 family)
MPDPAKLVLKPGRYTGGEVNQVVKPDAEVKVRFALAFPDVYEISMSHSGQKILYHILNSMDGVWAQRVFAPWPDMAEMLEDKKEALFSLEEKRPVGKFDIVGFSLMHELSYTTMLRMLRLSDIPLYAAERGNGDPIVIAGGTSVSNPCPVMPFFDFIFIGDGEEAVSEIAAICLQTRDRKERIEAVSKLAGVFRPGSGEKPVRRILTNLDSYPFPANQVVPNIGIIHDRLGVEVARGCTRGCRFCQAGMLYRPYRERSFNSVMESFRYGLASTGYDSLAMTALSITDLSYLDTIMESLICPSREISLSVPSMRVEGMTEKMADIIASVKKPGFTLAVEAATERLRAVINKGNTEDELMRSISIIKKQGWRLIKLYFMFGLPTETEGDIEAIVKLTRKIANAFRGGVNVSVSTFIPKTFTPFQWEAQIAPSRQDEILKYLKRELRDRRISLKWSESPYSLLEEAFSRGDEKLAGVIEKAFGHGAYLDGWSDTFRFDAWTKAFDDSCIDPREYLKQRPIEVLQPWEFIDMRISRDFLLNERLRAINGEPTPDCRTDVCSSCGVCGEGIANTISNRAERIELFSGSRAPVRFSYIVGYAKEGPLPLIGNRDLIETFKRAVRRSGLRASYSEGFSPVMRLTLIPPLPLGIASLDEYMQLELSEELPPEQVGGVLAGHMPEGSRILSCERGKLKQVESYSFRLLKPCKMNFSPDSMIAKGEAQLRLGDFIESCTEDEITIRFADGRTISPLALAEAFGDGKLAPSDVIKTKKSFFLK